MTQSADLISWGLFLIISTHHYEMFKGTRFREEVNYISFRLKRFWELIIKSPWCCWGIIACLSSVIPFQGKWNSILSLIWEKNVVLYDNTEIIERAFYVYWYIKYKIPSVYAQTYGEKYSTEDFKWASSHLLPTPPKLFITAWHIHVAAKWQILIKQSFQRVFSPLSGRNYKLI